MSKIFDSRVAIYVSTITEIEVLGFPQLTDEEKTEIEKMLKTMLIVPLDSQIANIAASIRRMYRLKTPDSAVAATALFTGTILLTRNIGDFKKITGLRVEEI
ncbi:MAG: PilT protein domain protein [Parcubacteria group bacterium Gr01-1014_66]|nr:MAG: PilT protein domain protein [Parcubacteria group bacterium Gr01-1014_66]